MLYASWSATNSTTQTGNPAKKRSQRSYLRHLRPAVQNRAEPFSLWTITHLSGKWSAKRLCRRGFDSCVHAENGADALITAERVKPNAIILDVSMPVMNGLEAAPRLRQILPNTPIILYTLYEPAKLAKVDVSKMGVSLVASKDEPLQSLISKVESLVREK